MQSTAVDSREFASLVRIGIMGIIMRKAASLWLVILVFAISAPLQQLSSVTAQSEVPVIVHYGVHLVEMQTRSTADAHSEYLVLYNQTDESIDLSGWRLEYKPATSGDWSDKLLSSQPTDATFMIESHDFFILASNNYLEQYPDQAVDGMIASGSAESQGHIRLLMPDVETDEWWVVDQLGWGDADSSLGQPAAFAERGSVLQRRFTEAGVPQNTYDNNADFQIVETNQPLNAVPTSMNDSTESDQDDEVASDEGQDDANDEDESSEGNDAGDGGDQGSENSHSDEDEIGEGDSTEESENEGTEGEATDEQQSTEDEDTEADESESNEESSDEEENTEILYCEGVVLSEMLPNPQGPRSTFPREDHAYIELHNPTSEAIPLEGCGLQTSANDSVYRFGDVTLQPEDYRAFYETETDVQLPVSPSGTVYFLSQDDEELETATYPEDMPEAAAWAWFGDDDWQQTYELTPAAHNQELDLKPCPEENQERNPETNRCRSIKTETTDLVPCLEGQERNPETNRCRSIDSGPTYVPCGPNQERNPDTNRCRTIGGQQRQLVPCEPHQERNPETNRCRNVVSASSDLVPCEPHQERNPETNRCRNVAQANSDVMGVQDIAVPTVEDDTNWTLIIGLLSFAFVYGAWEWRHDAYSWYLRRKQQSA